MARHVQLNNVDHKDLRIITDRSEEFGDGVMTCALFPTEFRDAQNHYPIVFCKDASSEAMQAVALFGFERGENLFLGDDGWDARYIPKVMEMQPFLIGFRHGGDYGEERATEVHFDLEHPRVSFERGEPVFLEHGGKTPLLDRVTDLLGAVHAGNQINTAFVQVLEQHGLLEPFSLDIQLNDGSANRLVGFSIINEDALQGLSGDVLRELNATGFLLPIFMAVASLSNFADLIDRKNARRLPA